jgi:excisionase family DNA binding protein
MSTRQKPLKLDEIQQACDVSGLAPNRPILTPDQLAELSGLSVKTIYEWIAKGRLDGAFRKRGKHNLIWRYRGIALIFNGPEWSND